MPGVPFLMMAAWGPVMRSVRAGGRTAGASTSPRSRLWGCLSASTAASSLFPLFLRGGLPAESTKSKKVSVCEIWLARPCNLVALSTCCKKHWCQKLAGCAILLLLLAACALGKSCLVSPNFGGKSFTMAGKHAHEWELGSGLAFGTLPAMKDGCDYVKYEKAPICKLLEDVCSWMDSTFPERTAAQCVLSETAAASKKAKKPAQVFS